MNVKDLVLSKNLGGIDGSVMSVRLAISRQELEYSILIEDTKLKVKSLEFKSMFYGVGLCEISPPKNEVARVSKIVTVQLDDGILKIDTVEGEQLLNIPIENIVHINSKMYRHNLSIHVKIVLECVRKNPSPIPCLSMIPYFHQDLVKSWKKTKLLASQPHHN